MPEESVVSEVVAEEGPPEEATEVKESAPQEDDEPQAVFVGGEENPETETEETSEEDEEVKEEKTKDKKPPSDVDELKKEIYELKTLKNNLQRALSQARQEKKQPSSQEVLSPAQVKQIIAEHGDNPEVMYNIVQYVASQSTNKQLDANRVSAMRSEHDKYISQRWPEMADEDSQLSVLAKDTMGSLQLENHPLGKYLALSSLICEQLPNYQKMAYEQGKADALKGKAEKGRQKGVKADVITPAGSGRKAQGGDNLPEQFVQTASQLNMTPGQRKIYARLVSKGAK
jgi:hypothetical protein